MRLMGVRESAGRVSAADVPAGAFDLPRLRVVKINVRLRTPAELASALWLMPRQVRRKKIREQLAAMSRRRNHA